MFEPGDLVEHNDGSLYVVSHVDTRGRVWMAGTIVEMDATTRSGSAYDSCSDPDRYLTKVGHIEGAV